MVPPLDMLDIIGNVRVLFSNTWAAVKVTNVSAPDGITTVPPLDILVITGKVRVLFVIV